MLKKTKPAGRLMSIAVWAAVLIAIGGVLADSAYGKTKAEIVFEAKNKYTSAWYNLTQIVNEAFDSAKESGIAPADISAALSQILLETSSEIGVAASGNICVVISDMLIALLRVTENEAELSDSFSQSIQGIRAATSRMGLTPSLVRNFIDTCIENLPLPEEQKQRFAGYVASAYQQTHATNYIPSPFELAPEPPPSPPAAIADAYDPTASSTR